jgi:membrane protein required for colicin V production
MPSYLDLGLIVIILISALLSMVRGFTREVLAIGSWAAAAAAGYFFYPQVMPYVSQFIHKEVIAEAISAAAVFFVTLIVVSVFTVRLSDAILDSKIGALDRSLGFLFGAARGFLLGVVAFAIFNWLVGEKQQPVWVKDARTRPIMLATADRIIQLLPEDTEHTIENWLKNGKIGPPTEEQPSDEQQGSATPSTDVAAPAASAPAAPVATAPAAQASPPAPAPAPAKPATGATAGDKQKLDKMLGGQPPKQNN